MPKRVLLLLSAFCCALLFFSTDARMLGDGEKDFVAGLIDIQQPDTIGDQRIVELVDEGKYPRQMALLSRRHPNKKKKIFNHIYPILAALLFAKVVVVPLILKMLIAATSSAFVMSKIALATSVFMAVSWLLGATRERAKLQIVQYPVNTAKKVYGGWHVKHAPPHATSYSDWGYDPDESNDKSFFL